MRDVLLIVHILAAATWLGAGVTVGFLTPRLRRAGDEVAGTFMAAYEKMGLLVFNPAGVLVLVTGVVLVIDGSWTFEDPFVVIGVAVVIIGAVLGARIFTPLSREAQAAHASGDVARLDRIYARFRTLGMIDVALVALAIVVMVLRLGA
jgi:uncharacterized membrane protein